MADSKITALTSISTSTDPANDPLVLVDVSDTSMAASGTTKKVTLNNLLACSPTATLASATITGDLTARTTGLTVNSSGVGIGTNLQSSFVGNSPKKLVIGDGTQTPALTLYGGSAYVGGLYFADGTVGNQTYRGYVEYDHNTDSFGLGISGSLAMTLNATGLGVGTSPTGKLTIGTGAYVAGTLSGTSSLYSTVGQGLVVLADGLVVGTRTGSDRFILDTSGNVGIGVTPVSGQKLTVLTNAGISAITATAADDRLIFTENMASANLGSQIVWKNSGNGNAYASIGFTNGAAGNNGSLIFSTSSSIFGSNNVERMRIDSAGNPIFQPSATPATLGTNGMLTVNATSNTNLRFSYRGSDGVTRVANITLA